MKIPERFNEFIMKIKKLDLDSIIDLRDEFPVNQYYPFVTDKKCICIHHTVSGRGSKGDIAWWKQTKSRIATPLIIERSGKIVQLFSTKFWAHHLGVKNVVFRQNGLTPINTALNKMTIGIELDSWGALMKDGDSFYPVIWSDRAKKYIANTKARKVSKSNVFEYANDGYRGFKYYERYTKEQLMSLGSLIKFLGKKYGIVTKYNNDMWNVSKRCLSGQSGVWSHTSYRKDKSDVHPQDNLIELLKSV